MDDEQSVQVRATAYYDLGMVIWLIETTYGDA
jgi:hypothetical protein